MISVIKIRLSWDNLIFILRIPKLNYDESFHPYLAPKKRQTMSSMMTYFTETYPPPAFNELMLFIQAEIEVKPY